MNGFELNYSQVFTKTLHNPNNRGYHNIVSVSLQYLEEDNPNQHEQIATNVTDEPKDRKCHHLVQIRTVKDDQHLHISGGLIYM